MSQILGSDGGICPEQDLSELSINAGVFVLGCIGAFGREFFRRHRKGYELDDQWPFLEYWKRVIIVIAGKVHATI